MWVIYVAVGREKEKTCRLSGLQNQKRGLGKIQSCVLLIFYVIICDISFYVISTVNSGCWKLYSTKARLKKIHLLKSIIGFKIFSPNNSANTY